MHPKQFSKMHGLGNDFIVINCLKTPFQWSKDTIIKLADRYSGIGFDQLLIIEPPSTTDCDFAYRIFNNNGNEVEHCGNGARCFGKFVRDKQLFTENRPLRVAVKKGIIDIEFVGTQEGVDFFRVNMGEPDFSFLSNLQQSAIEQPIEINDEHFEATILSIGNPHAVITVDNHDDQMINTVGYALQNSPLFPQQVNVGFMQIISHDKINLRVFERGVGETQACGTGACAAMAAGRAQEKLDSRVTVALTRGELIIEWQGKGHPLYMTGPAEQVYEGLIS